MRRTILSLVALAIGTSAFAQLAVQDPAITVELGYSEFEKSVGIKVYNESSSDPCIVDVTRNVVNEVPGSSNYFCWGNTCYGAQADKNNPNDRVEISPQGENSSFIAYYRPNYTSGVTDIQYTFSNVNNTFDRTTVNVKFDGTSETVSVYEFRPEQDFKVKYNRAESRLNVVYANLKSNAKVEIRNIAGKMVFSDVLTTNNGLVSIATGKMNPGIHIVSLISESGERLAVAKLTIL